jgi:dsDNA-specific endonuclease/ATPase MutS2
MSTSAWLVLIAFGALFVLAWLAQRQTTTHAPVDDIDGDAGVEDVGVIEIEDAIDLHGFQPKEIPAVVESYLEAAAEKGLLEVRLIHGRGKGVQRRRVQSLLERHPLVEAFSDAPAYRGGWGATVARLRKKQ